MNLCFRCLIGAAGVGVLAVSAALAEPYHTLATECALRETKAITLIEDHGDAGDIPSDKLAAAGVTMFEARLICYQGRVDEALALYDAILRLGPVVASKSRERMSVEFEPTASCPGQASATAIGFTR